MSDAATTAHTFKLLVNLTVFSILLVMLIVISPFLVKLACEGFRYFFPLRQALPELPGAGFEILFENPPRKRAHL